MKILVLGPGCTNCQTVETRTREALAQLGREADISHVREPGEIASWGVMRTPGLVIDEELVVSGRVPSVEQIVALLEARHGG